ncbi:MAG TPA: DUF4105 domain-containing protein [Chthoniobacterales bacterium]|nr:DUF4105 domain-containing protein [Chthoniobacterales bacterium]
MNRQSHIWTSSLGRATLLLFWILFASTLSYAADPATIDLPRLSDHATISLVTYSPWEELYTAFGHSSIRVRDDAQQIDRLYNYGTFDFETKAFYLKFARGDLLYQLSVGLSNAEINERGNLGQGVTESILNLDAAQRQALFFELETNLLPENRFYRYDFLLDNCSTRVRDIFEKIWGHPVADPSIGKTTFRQMLDPYFLRVPWIRFGIYLLLGARVDRSVAPREACFLPYNLELAVQESAAGASPLGSKPTVIYSPQPLPSVAWYFRPQFVFWVLLCLWLVWWFLRGRSASPFFSGVILVIFGALGTFLVIFAANTLHWEAYDNWNHGWLVPSHLLAGIWLIFFPRKWRSWLRIYLAIALAEIALFVVASPWLPQQLHHAIYPLAILLGWRCAIELCRKHQPLVGSPK